MLQHTPLTRHSSQPMPQTSNIYPTSQALGRRKTAEWRNKLRSALHQIEATPSRNSACSRHNSLHRILCAALLLSTLASCTARPWMEDAFPRLPQRERTANVETNAQEGSAEREMGIYETPRAPGRYAAPAKPSQPAAKAEDPPGKEASVVFNSLPLPQFIDGVFAVILKKTIAIDPQIAQRKDLVSMRTGKPQSPSQLDAAAKEVLRAYGIRVQELPGLTRFVPENNDAGSLPEIRRGRAMPEVPESIRPVFYLAELEHTNVANAMNWLRTTFQNKVTLQDDSTRNAIMISGAPQNVAAAMQALIALDQPLMRGKLSARISPVYWSADEISKRLNDILTTEGYYSGTQSTSQSPVILLPVAPISSVIVFAPNQKLLDHILQWAKELDQPSQANNGNYFIYPVRNADAADIAATLTQMMGGASAPPAAAGQPAVAAKSAKVVVDKATNGIIIQSTPAEYQQWFGLLKQLDRPARSALVSVTVAEVKLDDGEQFGFEWMVRNFKIGGDVASLSTKGAFGTENIGGMAFRLYDGVTSSVVLNALATSNKAKVLSNPSILTRSGEEASITVGQEVPIITSQQSNADTTGGILQTIQYRNTGVLLKVKPVVHSGGRIDLNVSQEVSSVENTRAGVASSPSFSTRKVDTKLTVSDGRTVVLGGLMSDNRSDTDTGVPYLKDIPVAGNLFKSYDKRKIRTELVVMITSYAIEDDFDVQSIADSFRRQFPWTEALYNSLQSQPVTELPQKTPSIAYPATPTTADSEPAAAKAKAATAKSKVYTPATASSSEADALPEYKAPPPGNFASDASHGPAAGNSPATVAAPPPAKPATPAKPLPPGAPAGNLVTDDALKQELLKAIKGMK